ncbi:MAG: hypothetical protein KatS3mg076_2288 [Candidatus Binatia bacterium]|nr:MAG: hypothetical protein KatS3mg076_2288 [Candidatus Binatia bacterium]
MTVYGRAASSSARAAEILEAVDGIHRCVGFRSPPFRLEEFLARFDTYRVFEVDLPGGLDGKIVLTPDGEQRTIYLRKQNPRTRIRFTLAHEIVHGEIHFPEGRLPNLVGCRRVDPGRVSGRGAVLEREANFGAAALLAPLWSIAAILPPGTSPPYPSEFVRALARKFLVSESTMAFQLEAFSRGSVWRRPETRSEWIEYAARQTRAGGLKRR